MSALSINATYCTLLYYYAEMAYKVDMLKSLPKNYNQTVISAFQIPG